MAAGKRPDPFRTRKLSPPALMVLPPGGGGRVSYRRPNNLTTTIAPPKQHTGGCGCFNACTLTPPRQCRVRNADTTHCATAESNAIRGASRTAHCTRYPARHLTPPRQSDQVVEPAARAVHSVLTSSSPHCGLPPLRHGRVEQPPSASVSWSGMFPPEHWESALRISPTPPRHSRTTARPV